MVLCATSWNELIQVTQTLLAHTTLALTLVCLIVVQQHVFRTIRRRRKLDKSLLKNEELLRSAPVPNATSEALSTELNQQALMSRIESRIEQLFSAIDVSSVPSKSQITAQSHKMYHGLQSLFDEITSVVHFSKRFGIQHGWLEFEIAPIVNNILNDISTHITDRAPSVEYQCMSR